MNINDHQPEADDPLYEPREGGLVGQLGAEGGCVQACGDIAVVELCAQRSARLAVKVISYARDGTRVTPRSG